MYVRGYLQGSENGRVVTIDNYRTPDRPDTFTIGLQKYKIFAKYFSREPLFSRR
jgi:hypothetical protein